ncbi:peptidoglycan-binding protein [Paludicola sp. MB14-C6]|uniref:peptidoglycan-binding protein n=1 Tax=Paludihabitans sp. MB14-C6 TaxID=3070656 RepID=UPI0027DB4F53|nr:peptidoglycan-binding protein [Paludicola sp. MB14-C6]WMJ24040.1 peptidoglycan-binding protein [Paludicola sp. MB14-C6]
MPTTGNVPVIPEYITVHLGKPDQPAQNIQVPFTDYIKNVASSEIYPTWPEEAIRANLYAQITYVLNRIYTEWYRSKGYNFDITNSTQYDQAFVAGREVFDNISLIVDDIFNSYVVKQGSIEPYFTAFCNGTTSTCDGLSQWGTVDLAKKGYTPYKILQNYYGNDINIKTDVRVQNILQSYPGTPLKLGMSSNEVKILQVQLNRIRRNYPSITKIAQTDGNFGEDTEKAVKDFQKIFNLTPDGIVGKSTWYKIKGIYNGVKRLSELTSEGVKLEEVRGVYPTQLKEGATGDAVREIQYYLDIIGYFNPTIPFVKMDGVFGPETTDSVKAFQKSYGLSVDGIVGKETRNKMSSIYLDIVRSLPAGYEGEKAEYYPGFVLKQGMRDDNIKDLQRYLIFIAENDPRIPKTSVTGYFGNVTKQAVLAFQKYYGLDTTGQVGPITWNKIGDTYNELKGL